MDISKLLLTEKDFEGLGVSAQSNPMEKPEEEAKAVFDELVKKVIAPRINAILEALAVLDLTADAKKPVSAAQQEALDKKVDRVLRTGSETEERVLSDNNYDDVEKENARLNTENRHSHSNKEVLDRITVENYESWNDADSKKHAHSNKEVLDGITAENYKNWNDADSKKHVHDNKEVLDGITEQDYRNWNGENVLTKDNTEPFTPTGEYQPVTKGYVDERVVQMGSADMTQAIYDPKGRRKDIFAEIDAAKGELERKVETVQEELTRLVVDSQALVDSETGKMYMLGVKNGALYYKPIEEVQE